jgi:hypothetical protein
MFSVAIRSHFIKKKCINLKYQEKNQHWVYFYHSNLKVRPFGPPLVAFGLTLPICHLLLELLLFLVFPVMF